MAARDRYLGNMSSDYDASEFVDGDFQTQHPSRSTGAGPGQAQRAPTREEVEGKVADTHQKLAELKRAQEELERERAALVSLSPDATFRMNRDV